MDWAWDSFSKSRDQAIIVAPDEPRIDWDDPDDLDEDTETTDDTNDQTKDAS
jgi:hypothetical protein